MKMKDHLNTLHTINKEIVDLVSNNLETFSFLEPELTFYSLITNMGDLSKHSLWINNKFHDAIKYKLVAEVNDTSNAVIVDNGQFIKLNKNGWNEIYTYVQKYNEIHHNKISSLGERINRDIPNLEKGELIHPHYLQAYLETLYDTLKKNQINDKTNKWLKMLNKILFHDPEGTRHCIIATLQSYTSQEYRKKGKDKEKYSVNRTILTTSLGELLVTYVLKQQPLFKGIISFYKDNYKQKKFASIPEKEIAIFKGYLEALFLDDKQQIKYSYNNYTTLKLEDSDSLLVRYIKDYILSLLYEEYDKNNVPFITIKNVLEENKPKLKRDFRHEALVVLLQVMTVLINECGQEFKTEQGKLPPLFKLDTITQGYNKRRAVVNIAPSVVVNLMESSAANKPYLEECNVAFITEDNEKDTNKILNLIYENKSHFIRQHKNIFLEMVDKCYLGKQTVLRYMTIDRYYFLNLLKKYKDAMDPNKENSGKDKLMLFCLFYHQNDSLFWLDKTPGIGQIIVKIITYGLSFKTESFDEEITLMIKALDKQKRYEYSNIYNKVKNTKIILRLLLKECLLYLPFRYNIRDIFLDGRSRFYENVDLSPQLFPFAKALVKPFTPQNIEEKYFPQLKDVVYNYINNPEIKEDISKYKYSTYISENKTLVKKYIDSFFIIHNEEDKDYHEWKKNYDLLQKDIETDNITFDTNFLLNLGNLVKKRSRLMYVHSLLLLRQNCSLIKKDAYLETTIVPENDATTSGFQMTSITVKSPRMAELCNLMGKNVMDLYTTVSQEFKFSVIHLKTYIEQMVEVLVSQKLPEILDRNPLSLDNVNNDKYAKIKSDYNELFATFINMDVKNSLYDSDVINDLYNKLIEKKIDLIKKHKEKIYVSGCKEENELNWLLLNDYFLFRKNINVIVDSETLRILVRLKNGIKLLRCLKWLGLYNNDAFFNMRALFKDAIMTFLYNATAFGRRDKFIELLTDFIDHTDKYTKEFYDIVYTLSTYLESFFSFSIGPRVQDGEILFDISKVLSSQQKPVVLVNEFFKMTYDPKLQEKHTVATPVFNGKRGVQLVVRKTTEKFDKDEFDKAFIPNFIHYLDAYIAHSFNEKMIRINIRLAKITNNTFQIYFSTNHDSFSSSVAPFSKFILEDCYLDLIIFEPHKLLTRNLKASKPSMKIMEELNRRSASFNVKRLSPHFMKVG